MNNQPQNTPTTTIKVKNLNVYYGDQHALKNINLDIPDRKITAIIGASGCGKTTLLKCFNRLIDTYDRVTVSGELLVDNLNIFNKDVEITSIRKKMGLVSQRPFPLPMSIFDNVAYGLKIHGETNKEVIAKIVEEQLRGVSLWEEVKNRLSAPASKLSIGQQQRLCLARGLAVQPQIILGDEPTSALDPISSKYIEEHFVSLKATYTIIMVTHSLSQARRIADHVVFMDAGEIIEQGTAAQILEYPTLEKTRDYVLSA